MTRRFAPLVLALSLAAGAASAQQPDTRSPAPGPRPRADREAAPGQRLRGQRGRDARRRPQDANILRFREELGLTADQESRLRAIRDRLRTQNEPLFAQLRAVRDDPTFRGRAPGDLTAAERQQLQQRMQPLTEQMRNNQRTALQQASQVLTPEQRERLQSLAREARARHRVRAGDPGRRPGTPRGERPHGQRGVPRDSSRRP